MLMIEQGKDGQIVVEINKKKGGDDPGIKQRKFPFRSKQK